MTDLDLARYVRPGDRVVWGQGPAEPQTLIELLVAQRERLGGGVTCFIGLPGSDVIRSEHASELTFQSYCGTGRNQRLPGLAVIPVHYAALPGLLAGGRLAADVVFVQVSAPDEHGRHSLGLGEDYFSAALDTARVVIAEVNDQVPYTFGTRTLSADDWTACVHSSRPPAEMRAAAPSATAMAVARKVAALVDDGATVQFGVGTLPEACLDALGGHRDLGLHSGLLSDAAMRLIQAGVATGDRKTLDRGVAVAGFLGGTAALFRFAHRNPRIQLRGTGYTHDPLVLARQHQFTAINSALEVDLSGQVNAEELHGRYVGSVGGATDFLRGAARSPGGLPIVALPATAGGASRIVARLNGPVSTARSDAGVIVTEHGVADLRGAPVTVRYERMLAIAHPEHRAALAAELEEHLMNGALR
ncbi:MAG TPA: acetyl-CoA hydrolase/transferase C-terminal domain-containing protein [Streptosporangiaceae bacterium]